MAKRTIPSMHIPLIKNLRFMYLRFIGVDFTDLCSMSLKVFKLLRLEFYIYTFYILYYIYLRLVGLNYIDLV